MKQAPVMPPGDFFDLHECVHQQLLLPDAPVWTALDRLPDYLASFFEGMWPLAGYSGIVDRPLIIVNHTVRNDLAIRLLESENSIQAFEGDSPLKDAAIIMPGAYLFDDRIIVGPRTVVEPGALIKGPTVLGADTEVRQGAYLRGNCLISNRCVVGHTTEIKSSVMLDGAKAGHFAYIGDSILGNKVSLGAGTKLANLKMIPGTIRIAFNRKYYNTGRRKLGAILGDQTETGCNSVTSPGTLIKPNSIVYSGICVPEGCYPERSYFKPSSGSIKIKQTRYKL